MTKLASPADDARLTPPLGVSAWKKEPPGVAAALAEPEQVVAPSARPGSGVHFNRIVRMPEHVSQAKSVEAAPASPGAAGRTAAIIGLLVVVAGLLLFLVLR